MGSISCGNCGDDLLELTEVAALRKAFRMMNLDPEKITTFISENGNDELKALLFECISLDEEQLAARAGEKFGFAQLMDCWKELEFR